jgi:pyrimidine operon attenuation protein/uracil phosphoribosyltransferase
MTNTTQLPDAEQLLQQLVQQILPHVTAQTALVGIHSGGAWLAQRLHAALDLKIPLGTLDISFYRDDFSKIGLHPQVRPSDIPFDVADHDIVLVDDVLHTGRTVRAAMNELFDYGRPSSIRLAVLVDRGGRELPICPDFIGARLALQPDQNLQLNQGADGKLDLSLFTAD